MKAILSYCGHPIQITRDGEASSVYGWFGAHPRTYPEPIGRRLLSYCDVPDLALFPTHYGAKTCTFSGQYK